MCGVRRCPRNCRRRRAESATGRFEHVGKKSDLRRGGLAYSSSRIRTGCGVRNGCPVSAESAAVSTVRGTCGVRRWRLPLSSFSCRPKGYSSFGPAQRRVCGVGRGQVLAAGIVVGRRKGSSRQNLRPTDGACYLPSLPVLQHRDSKGKTSLWPSGALFLSSVFCAFLGKRERGSARAGAAGPGGLGEREDQRQSGGPRFEHAGGDHRDGCAHRGCPVSEGAGIGSVRSMTLLRRREERQDAGGE